jgi:hypothetical protein
MAENIIEAVLKAADEWVFTQEALVTARQASNKTDDEQEAVDDAGVLLVLAVMRWRSSRIGDCRSGSEGKPRNLTISGRCLRPIRPKT